MRYPEQYQYYCWFARNKVNEPELQRLLIVMADHIGADDPILIEDLATVVYDNRNAERKVRDGLETLRTDYGIYAVGTGRICVAALNTKNMPMVLDAIAAILK